MKMKINFFLLFLFIFPWSSSFSSLKFGNYFYCDDGEKIWLGPYEKIKESAMGGNPKACLVLGKFHMGSDLVLTDDYDFDKNYYWGIEYDSLGQEVYRVGKKGIERNPQEGVFWLKKSLKMDLTPSESSTVRYYLALAYFLGKGCSRDIDKSLMYISDALELDLRENEKLPNEMRKIKKILRLYKKIYH